MLQRRSWAKAARILCLGTIATILAWLVCQQQVGSPIAGIKISATNASKTVKATIASPSLSGFDKNGQAYEITAQMAEQVSNQVVSFVEPQAELKLHTGKAVQVVAKKGVYNEKTKLLVLQEQVKLDTNKDEHVLANKAVINLDSGTVVSNDRVTVITGSSKIASNGFTMTNDGMLHFSGKGRMTVTPKDIRQQK